MLASIFEFVMGILGGTVENPEATGIVGKVFEFVLSIFGA